MQRTSLNLPSLANPRQLRSHRNTPVGSMKHFDPIVHGAEGRISYSCKNRMQRVSLLSWIAGSTFLPRNERTRPSIFSIYGTFKTTLSYESAKKKKVYKIGKSLSPNSGVNHTTEWKEFSRDCVHCKHMACALVPKVQTGSFCEMSGGRFATCKI